MTKSADELRLEMVVAKNGKVICQSEDKFSGA